MTSSSFVSVGATYPNHAARLRCPPLDFHLAPPSETARANSRIPCPNNAPDRIVNVAAEWPAHLTPCSLSRAKVCPGGKLVSAFRVCWRPNPAQRAAPLSSVRAFSRASVALLSRTAERRLSAQKRHFCGAAATKLNSSP
eukprot:scaffold279_cov229-Pinguiococcus_pyrenoidosus.AAC.29